jgi:hypothetical protein
MDAQDGRNLEQSQSIAAPGADVVGSLADAAREDQPIE